MENKDLLLKEELNRFINRMSELNCIPIIFFDNIENGFSGIASTIPSENIMEYMSDKLKDIITDLSVYDKEGKLPDSVKYGYLTLLNGVNKYLNLKDNENWELNWEKYKKGDVDGIPERMLNRFIENGYCPNDDGKKAEII